MLEMMGLGLPSFNSGVVKGEKGRERSGNPTAIIRTVNHTECEMLIDVGQWIGSGFCHIPFGGAVRRGGGGVGRIGTSLRSSLFAQTSGRVGCVLRE